MFDKLNPYAPIKEHFKSLYDYQTGNILWLELIFHIAFPLVFAVVCSYTTPSMKAEMAGIVVSAASIVAGLMLNLLVLMYTLAYNVKTKVEGIKNIDSFLKSSGEAIATISYSVFLCLVLIVFTFLSLSESATVGEVGKFFVAYSGAALILCLLILLKRCFVLVHANISE